MVFRKQLGRCFQSRVRSFGVVLLPSALDLHSSVLQAQKPVLVQALVSDLAVEALDVSVLNRLAGLNEFNIHVSLHRPKRKRLEGVSSAAKVSGAGTLLGGPPAGLATFALTLGDVVLHCGI